VQTEETIDIADDIFRIAHDPSRIAVDSPTMMRLDEWELADVHGQYSDSNSHADLYRFLMRWIDVSTYLNIGYSKFWQWHLRDANFIRLIDRIAEPMLELHEQSPHRDDRRLLDIGSGRGGAGIHANLTYDLEVKGVDITPYNVERANANARLRGVWPTVKFIEGDAQNLPRTGDDAIPDASVPLVWAIEAPAHFPDKRKFLAEVHRVLKPGGIFAFSDLLAVESKIAQWPDQYRAFLRVWDVPYLETFDSYREVLDNLGFDLQKTEIVTKNNIDIYTRISRRYLMYFRVPAFYKWYAKHVQKKWGANLDNVRDHMLHSYNALSQGTIDYGLFWAVKK
jgi:SAM-dependent methyltransferase